LEKSKNNVKKDDIQGYAAQFKLTNDINIVRNHHLREHCSASRDVGQQVRIEIPTANRTALALYTVVPSVQAAEPNLVYVGYTNLQKP